MKKNDRAPFSQTIEYDKSQKTLGEGSGRCFDNHCASYKTICLGPKKFIEQNFAQIMLTTG